MVIISKYFPGLTEKQKQQFGSLEGSYNEWNSKINVISRKDIESLYEKHVLHSLSIGIVFRFQAGARVIDIGTGGGFPGIPLAILFPDCHFTLIDSIAKKLKVVEAVADQAGLSNISIRQGRVEELNLARKDAFDFALSRAVAPLSDLWNWSKPIIKAGAGGKSIDLDALPMTPAGGGLICLKGGDLKQEIKESGTHPSVIALDRLFAEPFFNEKFLIYIPRK